MLLLHYCADQKTRSELHLLACRLNKLYFTSTCVGCQEAWLRVRARCGVLARFDAFWRFLARFGTLV